jgi:hypothetical protein
VIFARISLKRINSRLLIGPPINRRAFVKKLKLAAAIFALFAMPALAFGQGSSQSKAPKPTKADAQKVAQIISSDKAKLQAYCESKKL